MKVYLGYLILIFSVSRPLLAVEDSFDQLIQEGIKLHDAGKFREAVAKYDLALKQKPESCLALYEKVFSLWMGKDITDAVKIAEKAAAGPCKKHTNLRLVLASAYDDGGDNAKAIVLLEKLSQEDATNHYMHYNLAVSYMRAGRWTDAEQSLITALKLNPAHTSSHFALGRILFSQKQKPKGALCFYTALLLDPNGKNSAEILRSLQEYYDGLAENKEDKEIKIQVSSEGKMEDFPIGDLAPGMAAALAKSKKLSREDTFAEITGSYLDFLADLRPKQKGFYWSQYVDFFIALKAAKHRETFIRVIQFSGSEKAQKWVDANSASVLMMQEWVKGHLAKP